MQIIQIGELDPDDVYLQRFSTYTLPQLVEAYNRQVGSTCCSSARGDYLVALYQELKHRPVNIAVIDTGEGMWLDRRVQLDPSGRRLVLEPKPVPAGKRVLGWLVAWIQRHM